MPGGWSRRRGSAHARGPDEYIVSPHTAGHSQGQAEAVLEIFLDNLQRWCSGRKPRNDVDDLG